MRVQAVEMTRNNRAWKSQRRGFHIPHRLDGEHVSSQQQHKRITLRAATYVHFASLLYVSVHQVCWHFVTLSALPTH